jgi:hypothetical protein
MDVITLLITSNPYIIDKKLIQVKGSKKTVLESRSAEDTRKENVNYTFKTWPNKVNFSQMGVS